MFRSGACKTGAFDGLPSEVLETLHVVVTHELPGDQMDMRYAAALVTLLATSAVAQNYGSRPLRMIVPFPAGGGSDAIGRIIAPRSSVERLGQQVVVDNRAGAGGSIGTEAAVRATPDGYNMVLASTSEIAINPALYKLSYDTMKDLTPVAMIASAAMVVVVAPTRARQRQGSRRRSRRASPARSMSPPPATAPSRTFPASSSVRWRSSTWTHVPYKGAPLGADGPRRRPRRGHVLLAARGDAADQVGTA